MATLQDIADVVGVSSVTVSKVLRGKIKGSWPSSAARADRIRRVAKEMGYQVDWRARALKTKRTFMIGLLTTDKPETRTFDSRVLDGLIGTFGEAGYHLVFVRVGKGSGGRDFADARFDGIVIDYHLEPEEMEVIQRAELPAVVINAPGPEGTVSVMPDHFAAGRLAADHLLGLGHQRIAFIQSSVAEQARWPHHMVAMWREGIRRALREAGLLDRFVDIIPGEKVQRPGDGDDAEVYYDAMHKVFATANRPTALIVNNPKRAVNKVMTHLDRLGLRCPQDLSLLTMEDIDELAWCRPAVSSVRIPFGRLGERAARQLLHMIENDGAEPSTSPSDTMVSSLQTRSSTAPPPAEVVPARPDPED